MKGRASGRALVSREPFCFLVQVDPRSGKVVEKGHEWEGENLAGRVLVFPHGKGSSASGWTMYELASRGLQPAGIVCLRADPVIVSGAVLCRIPLLDRPDTDVLDVIRSGDDVELDAGLGIGTVKVGRGVGRPNIRN